MIRGSMIRGPARLGHAVEPSHPCHRSKVAREILVRFHDAPRPHQVWRRRQTLLIGYVGNRSDLADPAVGL